ncbi:MAG: hypothetical protein AB2L07_19595 [Thermoanaerobaculaceae bacterium]
MRRVTLVWLVLLRGRRMSTFNRGDPSGGPALPSAAPGGTSW